MEGSKHFIHVLCIVSGTYLPCHYEIRSDESLENSLKLGLMKVRKTVLIIIGKCFFP